MQRWLWTTLCVMGIFGCNNEAPRGAAGESCTARSDCGDGLACVAQVCVQPSQRGAIAAAGPVAGGEGALCRARRDCQGELVCLDNSCQASGAPAAGGARYSGRGESCQAKNDCAPDLACVMGACRPVDFALERTAKSCHRVECASRAECCASFVAPDNCAEYKKNCADDPVFCNSYHRLCECNLDCVDELCAESTGQCASNAECTSAQSPFCVDGKCAQCQDDSNCPGAGTRCNHGTCTAACTTDENCPLLQACQGGVCMDVGCQSDRECVFLMRDALAVCADKKCRVPCDADSDCASESNTASFQVCQQGQCVFVGCENDAECRALLGLQNMATRVRAVCKGD